MLHVEYRPQIDGPIYEELAEFLPQRVFDSHIHTGLPEHIVALSDERKASKLGFFLDVALVFECNAYEFAQGVRAMLFPEQRIEGLYFGYPFRETDLDANNAYVAGLIRDQGVQGLYMPRPESSREELERAVDSGFIGFKPYPDLVTDKGFAEMRLADYVPPVLWEVAHDRGATILIHLSRPGRLYDLYDIQDMSEACLRYPNARVIMAHIGRPYIPSMIRDGIPAPYKALRNLWFDICPICESGVLEVAIREVGPQRLLFGTDSPVTTMRGRLAEWQGDRKFFSDMDFPWNTARETAEKEARYTFFVYEQLLGLKKAAQATRLSRAGIEDIMYNNAKELTSGVR